MATVTGLPPVLRDKLASVIRRIRVLRAVRGLSLLVLVLVLGGAAALAADAALDLPVGVRRIILGCWVGVSALIALFGIMVPLCRRLDPDALAAVVEEQYPDLGERLTSTIELADVPDSYHGSRAFIDLLIHETENRSRALNFLRAFPARAARKLALCATAAVLLVLTPALLWPAKYADLGERFLFAWRTPAPFVPYDFAVNPGDAFAAKGRPITLAVRVSPRKQNIPLPQACTLVRTDADGKVSRTRMPADRPDTFSVKVDSLPGDFRYRIEANDALSNESQVTAVEPVELAENSPTITVTAPEYARATVVPQTVHGLVDLSALQYSTAAFDFRFTRAAVAATLEWQPRAGDKNTEVKPTVYPLTLSSDRTAGRLDLPTTRNGTYRVVLEAEHGIRTDLEPRALTVKVDQPPSFLKVSGSDDVRSVTPYENIPLEITVDDDVGVDVAEVEYRVNQTDSAFESIPLKGRGTRQAVGAHTFQLSGKAQEGDEVRYRIKAADNRRVPEAGLGPNVTYYPAATQSGMPRWRTLRVARQATPLQEQEIVAQRDDLNRRIEAIQRKLVAERSSVARAMRQRAQPPTPEQTKEIGKVRQENRSAVNDLHELARVAAESPALQPIAERAEDVARAEMQRSDEQLGKAEKENQPQPRARELLNSDRELFGAMKKLDDLRKQNEQVAQARLEQMKLETLASRQQELAERTAEQATRDPIKDPETQKKSGELQRDQNEIARDLQRQADESEPLRKALDAARAEKAKELAKQARELAEAQRELAKAETETERKRQQERLTELARKQEELARQTVELAKETRQPAEAARAQPLKPEAAEKAAEALKQGDAPKALEQQEKAARELERTAADLNRAVNLANDPREAARQLAAAQENLQKQLGQEAQKKDATLPERMKGLQPEQKAIEHAARDLSVPPQDKAAQKDRQDAAENAARAAEALKNHDERQADARMVQARQALQRLADRLPTLEQRQRQAQAEVARLRQQQEAVARQAEEAARQVENENPNAASTREKLAQKMGDAAKKQAEIAERIGQIDTPKQEARRERTQEATNRALADLMDARPQDIAATQQEARRQMERLEQALSGKTPPDEQARNLARRQRDLADEAKHMAAEGKAEPQKQQELQRQQQAVAQEAQALNAPEAPQHKREAAEATRKAAEAVGKSADAEAQQKMQEAAKALDRLARQMSGEESEAARAERLARRQAEAANEAERLAKKNANAQPNPEAQQRQQEVGEEAKQVRAGEEGQAEKQRALQALTRAQQAARPEEQASAKRQAADALRDLADRLAGKDDAATKAAELAREQRAMADDAAKNDKPMSPEKAQEAARHNADRQAELAHQVQRLDARKAAPAQKEAAEHMTAAHKALENAKAPSEAREQLNRAAEAAEKLAQELGKEQAASQHSGKPTVHEAAKPADQSPRQMAQAMARRQRELAQATQQAQNQAKQGGEQAKQALHKALQEGGQKQEQLNQQASKLPAEGAQRALEQARATMNQAQQALAKKDAAQAQQKQAEAANALEQLARQLPEQSASQKPSEGEPHAAPPHALPTKHQAEQARELAQQQRQLQAALQRMMAAPAATATRPKENPAGELARQQQEVAKKAGEMARKVGQEQGHEAQAAKQATAAAKSAEEAAHGAHAGAMKQAAEAGQKTAQQLRQLAGQLAQKPADHPGSKEGSSPQEAQQLAQRQEDLAKRMQELAEDPAAQEAQQQARQQDLHNETGELMKDLNQLAQQMNRTPPARQAAQMAAMLSQHAQAAMKLAQAQNYQGQPAPAHQSQQQAAQALDQAARQADQAAQQMAQLPQQAGQPKAEANPETGQAVQKAQDQMARAEAQLAQGLKLGAKASMKQASNALKQAAQQMAMAKQPGKPNAKLPPSRLGASEQGEVDVRLLGENAKKYAGKRWGDLPGELRTKIIQDMQAEYGEDYARMIKLYFEQIADTRKKDAP